MSNVIVEAKSLSKHYREGNSVLHVLNDIHFTIHAKDRIAILGPSGSGKSTLLHVLGGLDKPTHGQVLVQGANWQSMNERRRCQMRNALLGFVYQFHHLLPEFTALENVSMPLLLAGVEIKEAQMAAEKMLTEVDLSQRLYHKPSELSGGERQRVAIARALIHQPQCVFADEPTGNLDHATALKIFDLMLALNSQINTALVIVTHDLVLAKQMDRILTIQQGKLIEDR